MSTAGGKSVKKSSIVLASCATIGYLYLKTWIINLLNVPSLILMYLDNQRSSCN